MSINNCYFYYTETILIVNRINKIILEIKWMRTPIMMCTVLTSFWKWIYWLNSNNSLDQPTDQATANMKPNATRAISILQETLLCFLSYCYHNIKALYILVVLKSKYNKYTGTWTKNGSCIHGLRPILTDKDHISVGHSVREAFLSEYKVMGAQSH